MLTAVSRLGYQPTIVESELGLSNVSKGLETIPPPIAAVLNQQRLVFVDFYADWCGACKIMEATTLSNVNVQSALSHYIELKLNVDDHGDTAAAYSVVAMPTYLILDSTGAELHRQVGPIESEELVSLLNGYRKLK